MNKKSKIFKSLIFFCLIIVSTLFCSLTLNAEKKKTDISDKVDIVFTHDIHSYLSSYNEFFDGKVQNVGGMARLSTLLKEKREENPDVLVLDGGDLAMGTLYQTLYCTEATELSMLGTLRFDATTFGNHDFDYTEDMLCEMFNTAAEKNDYLPQFVICNMNWDSDDKVVKDIHDAALKCNLCDYAVVNKNGVNIAIIGVFGKVATKDSPTLKIEILDQIESVKKTVEYIKENENVDMFVCISHSGTNSDIKESEDEQLAMAIPELDVIISAHSHTYLDKPLIYNDTYILGCGCYGLYTGTASFVKNDRGRWDITDYYNVPMTEDIEEDPEILNIVSSYNNLIQENYLDNFGLTYDQVLCFNPYNFESVDDMYFIKGEHRLGNIMADAYRYAVNNSSYGESNPADIAIVPSGTIRGTFLEGNVDTEDAFRTYSLGIGYDNIIGNPLVEIYLTGKELKIVPEIDASLSDIMSTAKLYCSGLSYSFNNKRMFLNRAYDIKLNPEIMSEESILIEDDKLYSIVTDLYTARMIGSISSVSKGLIKIEPKLKDGSVLPKENDEYCWDLIIVKDSDGKELKTWIAIASYLQSFDQNQDGISVIPAYYNELHNRKIENTKFSLSNYFYQNNKYFWIINLSLLFGVIICVFILLKLIKLIKYLLKKAK